MDEPLMWCRPVLEASRTKWLGRWDDGLQFLMRSGERVCLAMYLGGRLVEVQGPVRQ